MVAADPMKLVIKTSTAYPKDSTLKHDSELLKLLEIDQDKIPEKAQNEAIEALGRLAQFSRSIFNLKEFEEDENGVCTGVTDAEAFMIFADFGEFNDGVKKNIQPIAISPASTESQLLNGVKIVPTTNVTTDCGLTKTGASSVIHSPSCVASE
jgi:hypothetical protein